MVTIGLTGDVMLGRGVDRVQRTEGRPPTAVWGDLHARLRGVDALLVNLECCLSTRGTPWRHTYHPYHFRADPSWAVPALRAAGVDCCSLANNHVLDFGREAFLDTLDALDEAEIARVGAARTEAAAWRPARVAADDLDVWVVAFTDNTPEFAAEGDEPGTARVEIDPDDPSVRRRVRRALDAAGERDPDLLVASLHWGPNMVEHPPDRFRRFARWLVDAGVDLLYGHSAHVFQGIELYDGAPILYDVGDFVDDYAVDSGLRNDRGFFVEVDVDPGKGGTRATIRTVRLLPIEIGDCTVHRATGDVAEWCRRQMRSRSASFGTSFEREGPGLACHVAR
jgi:poly-gamma-glutamate synthesis protein (capsule biosynthesis protein)